MRYSLSIILIISSSFLGGCVNSGPTQNPNIIYVLADDLGYGDISAFNVKGKIRTPNIDQLADEGIKFTDAHSASSVCTPTRYSILTGRYNWRSRLKKGVLTGKSKALIPDTRTTVASMLRHQGYQTAFVGKWHLGWDWALDDPQEFGGEGWDPEDFDNIDFGQPITNTPNDLGFDYAYGHSGSLDMAPYVYVENGRVTQIPNNVTANKGKYSWWREGPTAQDFIHERVTPHFFDKAINYIESSRVEEPFFLYLALPSPHTPILPTEEWQGKSGLNPYGDFVMMIDDYMGKLINTLRVKGIEENTLIIFTSDNGCSPEANFELLLEKGHDPSHIYRGHKADIFEGGHRVPFIAKWDGVIRKGTVVDQLVCSTDLMATCADIVGYSLNDDEGEDSFSMLPFFQANSNLPVRPDIVHHSIDGSFAIRKGDWKLILDAGSGGWSFPTRSDLEELPDLPSMQLYNLVNDPAETKNLESVERSKVTELLELLKSQVTEGRSTPGKKQLNDPYDGVWPQVDFIKDEVL